MVCGWYDGGVGKEIGGGGGVYYSEVGRVGSFGIRAFPYQGREVILRLLGIMQRFPFLKKIFGWFQ